MANNLTAKIGADLTGLDSGAKKAKEMLSSLVASAKAVRDNMQNMGDVSRGQVAAFDAIAKMLQEVNVESLNSAQSAETLSNAVMALGTQYGNLTNAQRNTELGKTIIEMQQQATAAKEAAASLGTLTVEEGKAVTSAKTVNGQFKALQKELITLTNEYRNLSKAEQDSEKGRELANKMSEIRVKAAELKDTIGDVKQEIAGMASDTSSLDAFNSVLSVSGGTLSTVANLVATVTGDTKAFQTALSTFAAVQSATNTITQVSNALQSSSIVMLKVRAIQERAAAAAITMKTAAESKGVAVTKAARVAQATFNAVAAMNPYVLLASAIVLATGAMYGLVKAFGSSSDGATETSAAVKKLQQTLEEITQTTTEAGIQFNALATAWNNTSGLKERQQFLKTYGEQLKKTGLNIKSVEDAERAFSANGIKNYAAYIKAKMKMQAEEAKMQKYVHDLAMNQLIAEKLQRELTVNPSIEGLKKLQNAQAQIKNNEKGIERTMQRMAAYGKEYSKAMGSVNIEQATPTKTTKASKVNANTKTANTVVVDVLTANVDAEIKRIQEKIKSTGDLQLRAKLTIELENLQSQKKEIEQQAKAVLTSVKLGKLDKNAFEPVKLDLNTEGFKEKLQNVDDYIKEQGKQLADTATQQATEAAAKHAEQVQQQKDAIDSLGSSFGQIGEQINSFAGENTVAGNALIAMSRMIIIAKNAEALADGIASAASIPFPANLGAIASVVASITAMFAALPKFAQGGIIGGNTTVADTTPILAHRGEAILNNTQQARLWRLLDSPINGQTTTTTGDVRFKIEGQNLVGVLKNYNGKISKIK